MERITVDISTGTITEYVPTAEETALYLEEAWRSLRAERNALLASSDWTVLSDTPTSTTAWKTYRQALRDLPANTTDPFNPVWPTPPS